MAKETKATKPCGACSRDLPKDCYSKKQWEHKKQRRCKQCVVSNIDIPPAEEKQVPLRAAEETPRYKSSTWGCQISSASDTCGWCGKAEEGEKLQLCTGCKNVFYCSRACQKLAWPDHKPVCGEWKKMRKEVKKENKGTVGINLLGEESGLGIFAITYDPNRLVSIIFTEGELRGDEEPGHHFASDKSKTRIMRALGPQGFMKLNLGMAKMTDQSLGTTKRTDYFSKLDELNPKEQFLMSCGALNDLQHAKSMLPVVLGQIRKAERKHDGSVPDIGDVTVRGYGLNALELASRRGNYQIAEWLATDPRTKVMLTRKDSAPVAWACFTNKVELAKMLVKHGADSHATYVAVYDSKPPAHLAAENGKLLAVKYLMEECGHDIHERDALGHDIRAALRRYNKKWTSSAGCVACDEYAKSKGVKGDILSNVSEEEQRQADEHIHLGIFEKVIFAFYVLCCLFYKACRLMMMYSIQMTKAWVRKWR